MLFKTQILEHCFILMLIHETPLSVVDKHQEQTCSLNISAR